MQKKILFPTFLALLLVAGCLDTGGSLRLLAEAAKGGGQVADGTLDEAALAIDAYCRAVPGLVRLKLRDELNARTKVGDLVIDCEGGGSHDN